MSTDEINFADFENIIDTDLNPRQAEAVRSLEGPLLVMAGAGSGKTRVLTYRIANLLANNVPPYKILAITFTNKAAAEMKSRAEKLIGLTAAKVAISTFHSFCARLLRNDINVMDTYNSNYIIYDAGDSAAVIRECIKELQLDEERFTNVAAKISDAKNKLLDAAQFREKVLSNSDGFSNFDRNLIKIYELYEKKLIENNALDFDDLIFVTIRLLRDNPDILEKYQERFKYILIDEYQDTNVAQYILTKMLAAKYKNICVVGDGDQSIYGWRGADMRNILNFENDYPDAKVVLLEQNYRSTKQILDASNGVIKNNTARIEKNLWTENETGEKVHFVQCMSDRTEAAYIAREVRRLVTSENFMFKEIAVLYRTNAQSRALEEKFMQAEIPYIIIGGQKFYERKEIKDILAYLRLIVNPQDNMSFLRIINVPRRGFGPINIARLTEFSAQNDMPIFDAVSVEETLHRVPQLSPRIRQHLRDFCKMIFRFGETKNDMPLPEFINTVLDETGYMAMLKEGDDADKPETISRIENLGSFINAATEFATVNENATLEEFLNHVALLTDLDEVNEEESRVSLMTIHSAKGLEFPVVFIAGMEEGLLPHANSLSDHEKVEEERRICYVAMTRAKKKLYLTAAEERKNFGRTYDAKISQFLKEIPRDSISGVSEKNAGGDTSHHSSSSRRNADVKTTFIPSPTPAQKNYAPKVPERPKVVWNIGDKVSHKKWGTGIVTKFDGNYLTIDFEDVAVGRKVLKAIAAPVEKVN